MSISPRSEVQGLPSSVHNDDNPFNSQENPANGDSVQAALRYPTTRAGKLFLEPALGGKFLFQG